MAKISATAPPSSRQSQTAPGVKPSASAPFRNTRSTRSQSVEVPEQPTTRRTRGGSRQASVESDVSAAGRKRAGRKAAATELAMVDEDLAAEEEPVDDALAAEQEANDDAVALRRTSMGSPGGASAYSGTTAKTSFSQEEITDLDTDLMLETLPDLASATNELLKSLVPRDPKGMKALGVPGSSKNKIFNHRAKLFQECKSNFGSTNYLRDDIILRKLYEIETIDDLPAATVTPDHIIHKANVAQMIQDLLAPPSNDGTTTDIFGVLETLDNHFPTIIAPTGPGVDQPTFTNLRNETFHIALAIRTQLAVARLDAYAGDEKNTPDFLIGHTFFEGDYADDVDLDNIASDDVSRLRPFNAFNAADMELLEQESGMFALVSNRLQALRAETQRRDRFSPGGLTAVKALVPWTAFIDEVTSWYHLWRAEVDASIIESGGVSGIVERLTVDVQRAADRKLVGERRRSLKRSGATPKKTLSGLAQLKKRLSNKNASPAVQPTAAEPAETRSPAKQTTVEPANRQDQAQDDWVRQEDDDDASERPTAADQATAEKKTTRDLFASFAATHRGGPPKPKKSFVVGHANAQKVQFDDNSQPSQQALPTEAASFRLPNHTRNSASQEPGPTVRGGRSPGKRARDDEGFQDIGEVSEDEGFEADTRATANADERRKQLPAGTGKKPRFGTTVDAAPAQLRRALPSTTPSPQRTQRKNPGSSMPAPVPLDPEGADREPPSTFYQRAKVDAKLATLSTQGPSNGLQSRTPWTPEEESALLELICEHGEGGVKYAYIKKQDESNGNRLWNRNPEQLRFKARNMKKTMLLAQYGDLPENWDNVLLDKKAIDELARKGIAYQQDRVRGLIALDE